MHVSVFSSIYCLVRLEIICGNMKIRNMERPKGAGTIDINYQWPQRLASKTGDITLN